MFNRLLMLMFALLFASQTIAAAFDSHSSHQKVNAAQSLSHLNLDESHKSHQEGALVAAENNVDGEQQEKFDCHHCCHCHAPTGVYIGSSILANLIHKSTNDVLTAKTALLSLWLTPAHRPPIV